MPFCPNCGKEIPGSAVFCTYCGKRTGFATTNDNAGASSRSAGSYGAFSRTADLLDAREIVMKKRIVSITEHYDFEDRNGKKLGEGDGNFFQFPARFMIYSVTGGGSNQLVMRLEGKLITLRYEFTLFDEQGNQLGTIKRKIVRLIGEEFWLEQNGVELMRIYGDFTEHDYVMAIGGQNVAQVHKKWVSVRDQFGVSITGQVDPRLVIGAVIVIEHVEVTERNR
jgi:uncharacterized protein YxjI